MKKIYKIIIALILFIMSLFPGLPIDKKCPEPIQKDSTSLDVINGVDCIPLERRLQHFDLNSITASGSRIIF